MRKNNPPQLISLPGGLRLVHRHMPGAPVDYCGTVVRVGSRDDDPDTLGMAHFVEHTIFKGTEKRSAWHILNRMERVGGDLNAYTTKEETVVYCASPVGNHLRAFELIADLVSSSRFPEKELKKERDVVADEINSYLDSPAEAILDDFEDCLFAGTPIGHNILGNEECLKAMTSERCREYLAKWYTRRNMVLFYSGPSSASRIDAAVERLFSNLPEGTDIGRPKVIITQSSQFHKCVCIDSHQCHVAMGAIVPSMMSPERFTFSLLNNILGGPGMNSLLNLDLREHRGLVYSVESNLGLMRDTGLICIYFGCDPDDADLCKSLVNNRLHELASTRLPERFVSSACKQLIGQIAVSSDNRESTIISNARAALNYGHLSDPAVITDHIRAVTPEMLREAAESIANPSTLTFN